MHFAFQYQVNVTVVAEGGMRVDTVPQEREAITTGAYRPGFCYAEGILSAGTYTIIVSTYKPGQVRTWPTVSMYSMCLEPARTGFRLLLKSYFCSAPEVRLHCC